MVFKQLGTNVIPYLLSELTVGDLAQKSGTTNVEQVRQSIGRSIAAEAALRYMGSSVTSAIPELTKMMASTNFGAVEAAAEILSDLGPQGAHVLVGGLRNTNEEAREAIPRVLRFMAMGNSGTNVLGGKSAANLLGELPALFDGLDTLPMTEAFDCSAAITQSVVSAFTRRLESTNADVRFISAQTLGHLGASAQSAIVDLE